MGASEAALELIKDFEGLMLSAYLDPVQIPTIGYGTIRYPDGHKVTIGDSISDAEAEAFLKFDCDRMADDISAELAGIAISQNQLDALVSFTYNLGLGAFLGSTLLKELKKSDFLAAGAEFPRWNKATVNGIKQELAGLTKRRAKERQLFEKPGGTPTGTDLSDQETVVSVKGFSSKGKNVVAAFDNEGNVVELLDLENSLPDTIVSVLRLYPNMVEFNFAGSGEAIPSGRHLTLSGLAPRLGQAQAPVLGRKLLVIGSEDEEDPPGDDVKNMQARLRDLSYYAGKLDGIFGRETDRAIRAFQADYFGMGEADGKVGPKTWKKLWGDIKPEKQPKGAPGKTYLRLSKTDLKDQFGLVRLALSYFENGDFVNSIDVCSGQARKQVFRTGAQSKSKSMEPLPEGKWKINNIEWADGKDNYVGVIWNNGLGPAKIRLDYTGPGMTAREDIEMHIDWNRIGAPGTAGCVGVQNVADFKTLVGWLRKTDPRSLFVDWELGTCPSP